MRHVYASRALIITCLVTAAFLYRPLRQLALSVFRFPLTATESLLSGLLALPDSPRLLRETAALRSELILQQLHVARLQETVRHLTRVEQLTQTYKPPKGLNVTIIGRTTIPTQYVVIVNRGARDGVVIDSFLLDVTGLVGRVLEVYPTTSLAVLLTDPNSRVACMVERSRELGLLVGTGGTLCQLAHLDIEADAAVGDRVVTAGLGGTLPKGLVVGTIVKVVRDESNATAFAWVRPAAMLRRLEEVLCLPPPSS